MCLISGKKLNNINCPVLAIFGEKDANVINWRQTIALYNETIGKNATGLTIKTFPDCNHNIRKCKTGWLRETITNSNKYQAPCDGYFDSMAQWLKENKFAY